jgi:hypothetical protein
MCEPDGLVDDYTLHVKMGFEKLVPIIQDCLDQLQFGKGQKRHGRGMDFDKQVGCDITRCVGIGFPVGQMMKKWDEVSSVEDKEEELWGFIGYGLMALLMLKERNGG